MSGQYYYPQQGQYNAPVRRTRTGAIIAIVVLILLLLIGLGVVIYFLTRTTTKTTTTPSTTSGTTPSTTSGTTPSTTSGGTTPSTTSGGTTPSTTSGGTTPISSTESSVDKNYWILPGYNYDKDGALKICSENQSKLAPRLLVGNIGIPDNDYWIWTYNTSGKGYQPCRSKNGTLNCFSGDYKSKYQVGCEGPYPSLPKCTGSGNHLSKPDCYVNIGSSNEPETGEGYWVIPGYNYNKDEALKKCHDNNSKLVPREQAKTEVPDNNYWIWTYNTSGKGYQPCRYQNGTLNCFSGDYKSKFQVGCKGPYPSLPQCTGSSNNLSKPDCYIKVT